MEDVRLSDWPEPPGCAPWLPAYGFSHDIEKDGFFADAGDGDTHGIGGSTQALYLETIVEETSDDLRSERSASAWLTDSDADSVIHVVCPGSECDSGSERDVACPAKRRRRERCSPEPGSDDSLSRSSSLAQFESLERSCAAASISPDSLESAAGSDATPSSPDSAASGRTLRAPTCRARLHPARAHLSAENLSEDSGYSELRATSAPSAAAAADTEIARADADAGGGSAPCLARAPPSPERVRPPHAARLRAASVPDDLDLCADPPRTRAHRAAVAPAPHAAHFRQSFEVGDSLTVSVADLTALDYRGGGARRPRVPPPPPPRAAPPPPPQRDSSVGSDSTTESERAFTREMEVTVRRLHDDDRRALAAGGGDFDRDISVLTARRLDHSAWGAWDDVLEELRRRRRSPTPSPPRHISPPRTPSPETAGQPSFSSTPLRSSADARVRSTPELRARTPQRERRDTPEELRASLQEVSTPVPSAPPARSVSSGSKGVTFSPVVAEVSWREVSESESARSESASDDASDAEVVVVGAGEVAGGAQCVRDDPRALRVRSERAAGMMEAGARPRTPRSRIAGFLSRFANFRFSTRKSDKKTRSAGATASAAALRAPDEAAPASATRGRQQFVHIPLKAPTPRDAPGPGAGGRGVTVSVRAQGGTVAHKPPLPARPPPARPAPVTAPGVLETDVDTARTVLHARSLLALAGAEPPAGRPHKSMEFLLDKENARVVQPPENELQKNCERVLSEHELRVQRSLHKLNVPEWYKNAPTPREGFLLRKRLSDASASAGWSAGLNSKTTSLGSLGQPLSQPPPSAHHQLSPATTSFGRWSTSRLNSNQTSPCSSTRSSVRGGTVSPLCSPSTRSSFSTRQPYLGWRSQERLACSAPRTPHERLASSLLATSPSRASEEIQTSIKEVTSAIVHYVSGLDPAAAGDTDDEPVPSPRGSQKLYWLESSFVGTKPLESPQTPLVSSLPPPHPRPPSSLRLDLPRAAPAPATASEWSSSRSPRVLTRPSPGSTTLEDVLDSLLGLPGAGAAAGRAPSPQHSPRRPSGVYCLLGCEGPRYEPLSNSSLASATRTLNASTPSEDGRSCHSARSERDRDSPRDNDATASARRKSHDDNYSSSTLAPGEGTVDNAATWSGSGMSEAATAGTRRPRTAHGASSRRRSEPFAHTFSLDRRTGCDSRLYLSSSRTSLRSVASLDTDNGGGGVGGEQTLVKCRNSKCQARAAPAEARRHYKRCHNCNYVYCTRECRRAHWEKHRKVCLHSRASTLCRQVLSAAKEDTDSLHRVSAAAHEGYLAAGRGVVRVSFGSPEAAEKFATFGCRYLGAPEFVRWQELRPTEMGAELYTEVVKLCKSYNPETKLILFVAVCVLSEVPTEGAVKWERQLVSRCAKLRLARSVSAAIQRSNAQQSARPTKHRREREGSGEADALVLTWRGSEHARRRAACVAGVQSQLERRGVVLRDRFPEVHARLLAYAAGDAGDSFAPATLQARDAVTGRSFVCVIAPDRAGDGAVVVDVGAHLDDQISTPM